MQPNGAPAGLGDDDQPFAAPEFESEEAAAPSLSAWQRIKAMFGKEARLYNLNWAISAFPDAPANYVLRGELLLGIGDSLGAAADFRRALELALNEVESEDWGLVAQALQDRALVGLRDAHLHSARYNRKITRQTNES